jgi:hypothetical protein
MAGDSRDEARERLAVLPGGPAAPEDPARQLEQDAVVLGRLLAAAADHQQSDGQRPDVAPGDIVAALALFEDMRLSLDRLETQVVIEARRRGLEWREIAGHQGLNSSQAASQRYQRLMTRLEEIRQGVR